MNASVNFSYSEMDLSALLDMLSDATSKYTRALSNKEPVEQLETQQSMIDRLIEAIESRKKGKI